MKARVAVDGVERRVDPLPGSRPETSRTGGAPLPCRRHQPERAFEVALGALGDAAQIGLGDQGDVRDLDDAGLHELQAVARARLDREHHRVGELGDLGLRLADAHGLDQDDVVERAHQHRGGGGRDRRARPAGRARPSSGRRRRHRRGRRRSASGRRAAHRGCGARTGRPRSRPRSGRAARQARTKAEARVDLPTPGGPVSPTTAARGCGPGRVEQRQRRLVGGRGLDLRQRPRQCRLAACPQLVERPAQWACLARSAACAAARRAIGTR